MEERNDRKWGKCDRLLKRRDFSGVQRRGRRIHGRFFIMIHRKGQGEKSRFGITVSRRVGNSVTRNLVKRRVREILRVCKGELCGVDVVFIAKDVAAGALFGELSADIESLILESKKYYG